MPFSPVLTGNQGTSQCGLCLESTASFCFASLFSRRNSKLKTRYVKLLKSTEAENGQANRKCLVQSKVHEGSVRLNPCLYRHQVTNPDVNQGSHLQSRLQTPPPPPHLL